MVICPRLRGSRSSVGGSLGLRSVGRLLNLDPLLRGGKVVTLVCHIPLSLRSCVRSVATNICIRDRGLTLTLGFDLSRSSIGVAVCHGDVSTGIDLGKTGIGNSRVGLDSAGLIRDRLVLCSGLGRV